VSNLSGAPFLKAASTGKSSSSGYCEDEGRIEASKQAASKQAASKQASKQAK